MLKQRRNAVETCTPLFRQAEATNDMAAADSADCYAALLRARIDARLPITTGADMVRKMFLALQAQQQARELMMEAHLTTPEVLRSMGLERMYGDNSDCPPTEEFWTSASIVPLPGVAA